MTFKFISNRSVEPIIASCFFLVSSSSGQTYGNTDYITIPRTTFSNVLAICLFEFEEFSKSEIKILKSRPISMKKLEQKAVILFSKMKN